MMIFFVGMYLIWTLTGIALLSGWSFPINSVVKLLENNHIGIIFGTIILNESKAELSREPYGTTIRNEYVTITLVQNYFIPRGLVMSNQVLKR